MDPVRVPDASLWRLWLVRIYHLTLGQLEVIGREIAYALALWGPPREGVSV